MCDLFEQLTTHLTEQQIGHWSNPVEKAVCVDYPGVVGFYRIYARIDTGDGQFHTCGQVRLCVPEGARTAVARLLALANDQQMSSIVELNGAASELRFSTSERLAEEELSGELIDRLIGAARNGLDAYLKAILSVVFGNEPPADALRQALAQLTTT